MSNSKKMKFMSISNKENDLFDFIQLQSVSYKVRTKEWDCLEFNTFQSYNTSIIKEFNYPIRRIKNEWKLLRENCTN